MIRSRWRHRQSGFTLIELMVAMTVGVILMTALTTLFYDSMRMADSLLNQAQLNRQAREMFDLVALGGYRKTVNITSLGSVTDNTDVNYNYVFGLRGRKVFGIGNSPINSPTNPTPPGLNATSGFINPSFFMAKSTAAGHLPLYRLALSPYQNESTTLVDQSTVLLSDQEADVTLTCTTDPSVPVGACTGATATVTGYLRIEPVQEAPRVLATVGASVETLALDLINARYFEAGRTMESDISSVYWNAFTNLID